MSVLSVNETQEVDAAGNLTDALEVIFTVPNQSGSFTVTVPKTGDPVAQAKAAIDAYTAQVEAIYGL